MKNKEIEFYEKIKDWDFSHIKSVEEYLTDWSMTDILNKEAKENYKILDLGTGGGEKVINKFPEVQEIIGTDLSKEMIKTAQRNLEKSGRKNIVFKVMDNLKMDFENNYFDIIVARHTIIDAKQVYESLKPGGLLLIRGVDYLDCWQLKRLFNRGQGYHDVKGMGQRDYETILDAGFKEVELVPIYSREYFETKEDLVALLLKTPIIDDFCDNDLESYVDFYKKEFDDDLINEYVKNNTTPKGILLRRRYYGITARK